MGMLLRRHDRTADSSPKVNGQTVKQEPKNRTLTPKQTNTNNEAKTPNYR